MLERAAAYDNSYRATYDNKTFAFLLAAFFWLASVGIILYASGMLYTDINHMFITNEILSSDNFPYKYILFISVATVLYALSIFTCYRYDRFGD